MPVVQKTSRTAYKSGNLSIDSPLKSDRQPLKIDNEATGILLSTDRVYLQNEPLSEKEVATKKYVDDNTSSSSSAQYWHQMISGYRINNTSTTVYYTFYRFWFENWSNSDSDPTSVADSDIYSSFFIAPRAGSITNIRLQGWANDTGATDPFKLYIYKAGQSSNEDTATASLLLKTGAITPPAVSKTFTHSHDFTTLNTFSEADNLYIWLKKDTNSGNQDLYYNICISGEYL